MRSKAQSTEGKEVNEERECGKGRREGGKRGKCICKEFQNILKFQDLRGAGEKQDKVMK